MKNNFIIKVQLSQFDSEGRTMMLAYNEDKSMWYEGDATQDVIDVMQGEQKRFFHAKFNKNKKKHGGTFVIEEIAPWQNW